MPRYCKAYPVRRLRDFSGWTENLGNRRKRVSEGSAEATAEVTDLDILYLHEDFTVTDGIFPEEHVVFSQVTPEWIEFCKTKLDFKVPTYIVDDAKKVSS